MRYIVFTFALCLLVVSAYAGTYVDNFNDGDFDGWETIGPAVWKVVDGVATCRNGSTYGNMLFFGEDDWRKLYHRMRC